MKFFVHGVVELALEGAPHGHFIGWVVIIVLCAFRRGVIVVCCHGMEDVRVNNVIDEARSGRVVHAEVGGAVLEVGLLGQLRRVRVLSSSEVRQRRCGVGILRWRLLACDGRM